MNVDKRRDAMLVEKQVVDKPSFLLGAALKVLAAQDQQKSQGIVLGPELTIIEQLRLVLEQPV